MKDSFRTPHTFDMSNYFFGNTVVVGGRDFEREEKEIKKETSAKSDKKIARELDWSFLKKSPKSRR